LEWDVDDNKPRRDYIRAAHNRRAKLAAKIKVTPSAGMVARCVPVRAFVSGAISQAR
jgi:hypothetical protein